MLLFTSLAVLFILSPLANSCSDQTYFTALAQKTNEMVAAIEHRFYGKYNPMPDLSGSSPIYHTIDNMSWRVLRYLLGLPKPTPLAFSHFLLASTPRWYLAEVPMLAQSQHGCVLSILSWCLEHENPRLCCSTGS